MSVFKLLVDFEKNEISILHKRTEIYQPFVFENKYALGEAELAAAQNVFCPLHNGATQFKVTVDFTNDNSVKVKLNSNAQERRDARRDAAPFTGGCV